MMLEIDKYRHHVQENIHKSQLISEEHRRTQQILFTAQLEYTRSLPRRPLSDNAIGASCNAPLGNSF